MTRERFFYVKKIFLIKIKNSQTCSQCNKLIKAGTDCIMVIQWNKALITREGEILKITTQDNFVNTEITIKIGTNENANILVNIELKDTDDVEEYYGNGVKTDHPQRIKFFHKRGCGFSNATYMKRLPGCYGVKG